MQDFRKLIVWRDAHDLAVSTIEHSSTIARGNAELVSQLRRATASVGANIAEGAQRTTNAQFAHFLGIALASLAEAHNHLLLLRDARLLNREASEELIGRINRLRPMLLNLQLRVRSTESSTRRNPTLDGHVNPSTHPDPSTHDPQP